MTVEQPDVSGPFVSIGSSHDVLTWLELRRSGIGASECAALFGEHPWESLFSLYVGKVGDGSGREMSERMEWGLELEDVIAKVYSRRTGRPVRRAARLLRSTVHPWAIATLDAWTLVGGAWIPLELKTTDGRNEGDWVDGPPRHYQWQLQQQALVTGASAVSAACLIGGNRLVWCDVDRDPAMVRRLELAGAEFWSRVERRDAPVPDGSEASTDALKRFYPVDDGSTAVLGGEEMEWAHALMRLRARRRELDAQKDAIENQMKGRLGNAKRGVMPDGSAVSWSTENTREHVVKASTRRVLRLHEPKETR